MKKDLLLLHGALGTKNQFRDLIPLLENSYTLHNINFQGHGGRKSDKDFSVSLFSENVIEYLKINQLSNVIVFGYSMGGYVALNIASQNKSCFSKIITLGTKFNWTPTSASKEVKMLNPKLINEKVPHFAHKLEKEHAPLDWEEMMNKTAKMMLDLGNGLALTSSNYQKILIPVYLGIGSKDTMVSIEETQDVHKSLHNSKLIILEEAPHSIEKINPEEIAAFISKSDS
ncbi:MAG: alpha/beta hydrolase [Flavobacteriaceae bacterium]|nr:alpha/beta hydrolase [Flavobacteriaceae bacterium]